MADPVTPPADVNAGNPPAGTPPAAVTPPAGTPPVETNLLKPAEKPADEKKVEGAPEKYADYTLPDNYTVNPEIMTTFNNLAKETNLPQATAQKFVDVFTKHQQVERDAMQKAWVDTNKAWQEATKTDKEIGGQNLEQNIGYARGFISAFGTPALNEALESMGWGNHPELVRLFVKAGKAMAEDKISQPNNPNSAANNASAALKAMYPNSKHNF